PDAPEIDHIDLETVVSPAPDGGGADEVVTNVVITPSPGTVTIGDRVIVEFRSTDTGMDDVVFLADAATNSLFRARENGPVDRFDLSFPLGAAGSIGLAAIGDYLYVTTS